MQVIERIELLMEEKGLKYNHLADYLGVGKGVVSNWRSRKTDPPLKYIVLICEFLEVPLEYLVTGELKSRTKESNSEIEQYLIDMFRKLPEREQVKIEGILEWKLKEQKDKETSAMESSLPRVEEKIIPYSAYIKEETSARSEDNEDIPPREVTLIGDTAAGSFINAIANSYFEETVVAKHKKTDFAVKVRGDSMEPLIKKGQIVEVQDTQFVSNGEIVIVSYNDGITCKKIYFHPNHEIELRSINEEYEPIFIKLNEFDIENNSFRVIGRVLL